MIDLEAKQEDPDDVSMRRLGVLERACGQLPRNLVKEPFSDLFLLRYFLEHPESIPERIYPDVPGFLDSLLSPTAERPVMGRNQHTRLSLYNAPGVLSLANFVSVQRPQIKGSYDRRKNEQLRAKGMPELPLVPLDVNPIQINIGISSDGSPVFPTLPAYIELALQRHRELLMVGFNTRLRVFSTGSIAARLDKIDSKKMAGIQHQQRELIDAYVGEFYPELSATNTVSTEEIEKDVQRIPPKELIQKLKMLKATMPRSDREKLEEYARKYGGNGNLGLVYAAYHTLKDTFRDGDTSAVQISVGGPGEHPFNVARGFSSTFNPSLGLGVVVNGLLCRTPPYLHRSTGKPGAFDLNFESFSSMGDKALLADTRPEGREIAHMVRCIRDSREGIFSKTTIPDCDLSTASALVNFGSRLNSFVQEPVDLNFATCLGETASLQETVVLDSGVQCSNVDVLSDLRTFFKQF